MEIQVVNNLEMPYKYPEVMFYLQSNTQSKYRNLQVFRLYKECGAHSKLSLAGEDNRQGGQPWALETPPTAIKGKRQFGMHPVCLQVSYILVIFVSFCMQKIFCLLFFWGFTLSLCAQQNVEDSLNKVIAAYKDEAELARAYNALGYEYTRKDIAKSKEAVNNAVKYSGTKKIDITTAINTNGLLLQIKDWGKGFNSSSIKKGNGLDNMQHRAKELGATLNLKSEAATGTMIQLILPV